MKRLLTCLMLTVLLFGCSDKTLQTVATSLDAASKATEAFQATIITLNQQGALSTDQTTALMNVALQIDNAGLIITQQTKQITSLSAANKTSFIATLTPVLAGIQQALTTQVLGIKDNNTRQSVQTMLVLIQTSITAAQVALQGN